MVGLLVWLIVGTLSGATAFVLLLDWAIALTDPDPAMHEGYGLQVAIAVGAAWIFGFTVYRLRARLRHRPIG